VDLGRTRREPDPSDDGETHRTTIGTQEDAPEGGAIATILIGSLFQPPLELRRRNLDESRIRYYLKHPNEIRGVLVYESSDNSELILVNGHHRVESARRLGWTEIDADIQPGTRVDANRYWDPDHRPWSEIERDGPSTPNRP
jgi:hypothetical protein